MALGPTQLPIQWVPGALSLEVKRPVREADHSPPSSAEVKNAWGYTSTPQYVFMAWCTDKDRDNLLVLVALRSSVSVNTCGHGIKPCVRSWDCCGEMFADCPP
jgi:hypothetical protein